MNIKHLIRFPKNKIVCQEVYQKGNRIYLPEGCKLYSGVTGAEIGTVMKTLIFDFGIPLLVSNTSGRLFTTKEKGFQFIELGIDGKKIDTGLMIPKGENLNFQALNDFIIEQETEYQSGMTRFELWFYLAMNKIKKTFRIK